MSRRSQRHLLEVTGIASNGEISSEAVSTTVPAPSATTVGNTVDITVTFFTAGGQVPIAGVSIGANTAFPAFATVAPARVVTDVYGRAVFTVTGVGVGASTISFSAAPGYTGTIASSLCTVGA